MEELRQTVAALASHWGDSFTLAAMNDTLRGCGIPAQVEETEDPLEVVVSFPGVEGIPAGFEQTKARIEEILPCHLLVKYHFRTACNPCRSPGRLGKEILEEQGAVGKRGVCRERAHGHTSHGAEVTDGP